MAKFKIEKMAEKCGVVRAVRNVQKAEGGREGGREGEKICVPRLLYAGLSLKLAEGNLVSWVRSEGMCYDEETGVEK